MRYFRHIVAWCGLAALVAGCSSIVGPSQGGGLTASSANAPRFLRWGRTPALPPPHTHTVTAKMRERARAAGWQQISAKSPFTNGPGTQLLMTDGTIMVQDSCTPNWYALTPDSTGSYLHGKWAKRPSMPSSYGPLYFASAVLADGKLIVQGGEYNFCYSAETSLGAIYDPVANTWTAVAPPSGWSEIGDAESVVLDDGTYMLGNCCQSVQALLNESNMTWTQVGNGKQDTNSEEGWTLLRNGEALTVNVFDPPYAQVYVPGKEEWKAAGQTPQNLISEFEIGPQTLMPNNTVFVAGGDGDTAIYHAGTGKWTQGPTFPTSSGTQLDTGDAPSALLVDGTVILPASPGVYVAPSTFFSFDGRKLKQIAGPPNEVNDATYNFRLLLLPTGQVLETDGSSDVEIYTPKAKTIAAQPPVITSAPTTIAPGQTYQITGTRFNGDSQTNNYGDDVQEATNYPLIRITTSKGNVVYARTHGHSYMGVGSNKSVTTNFDVPATIDSGTASLVVVTNGVTSKPVTVTIGT
jgi:hypothetical protein